MSGWTSGRRGAARAVAALGLAASLAALVAGCGDGAKGAERATTAASSAAAPGTSGEPVAATSAAATTARAATTAAAAGAIVPAPVHVAPTLVLGLQPRPWQAPLWRLADASRGAIQPLGAATEARTAADLAAGRVDVAALPLAAAGRLVARGAPVRVIAPLDTGARRASILVRGRPRATTASAALAGRRLGVNPGTAGDLVARCTLAAEPAGGRAVRIRDVGARDPVRALARRRVDGAPALGATRAPLGTRAFRVPAACAALTAHVLVARTDAIAAKADALAGLAARAVARKGGPGLAGAAVAVAADGWLAGPAAQALAASGVAAGVLDGPLDATRLVDPTILAAAAAGGAA